jgi:hypothetical protein
MLCGRLFGDLRGSQVVTSKWIYKIKHAVDSSIEKYKARFVARDFSQKEGVDYDETFSPVSRYTSIRTIFSITAVMDWILHQMGVKIAFLNGVIEEEVYIKQPQGFEVHGRESHVCRLKKSLYGLKQEPKVWYSRIDGYLMSLGLTKSEAYPNLYYKVLTLEFVMTEMETSRGCKSPYVFIEVVLLFTLIFSWDSMSSE